MSLTAKDYEERDEITKITHMEITSGIAPKS